MMREADNDQASRIESDSSNLKYYAHSNLSVHGFAGQGGRVGGAFPLYCTYAYPHPPARWNHKFGRLNAFSISSHSHCMK